jgi:hypothetical protein
VLERITVAILRLQCPRDIEQAARVTGTNTKLAIQVNRLLQMFLSLFVGPEVDVHDADVLMRAGLPEQVMRAPRGAQR